MSTGEPPLAFPLRLSWKGRAMVLIGSLAFIILALSMVMGAIEDPMFSQRARDRIEQIKIRTVQTDQQLDGALRELGEVLDEARRETHLINRYIAFNFCMALANPLLAMWLIGRCRTRARFVGWMTLAGLFWALSLTGLYSVMHRMILPGGMQDPRLPELLRWCLFAFCLVDSLLVAGIALRAAKRPAVAAVAPPPLLP
jgi:hypothetical protein